MSRARATAKTIRVAPDVHRALRLVAADEDIKSLSAVIRMLLRESRHTGAAKDL